MSPWEFNGWALNVVRIQVVLGSGTATGAAAFGAIWLLLSRLEIEQAQARFGFSIAVAAAVATVTWAVVWPLLRTWYGQSTYGQSTTRR